MKPYADELQSRVGRAKHVVLSYITPKDRQGIGLADLQSRGLSFDLGETDIYEQVMYRISSELPATSRYGFLTPTLIPQLRPAGANVIEARRLDESIREETELRSRLNATTDEIARLDRELQWLGEPVGVKSAVTILAMFSLFGVVAPVVVMAFEPEDIELWLKLTLLVTFTLGLAAVLGYVAWYSRHLKPQKSNAD